MAKTKPTTKSPATLDQAYQEVLEELLQTFLQKHRDYGKGNILAVKELGISMRITEKVERIKNLLVTANVPQNESLEDTWKDIAVYAIIGMLYRRGQFEALEVDPKKLGEI